MVQTQINCRTVVVCGTTHITQAHEERERASSPGHAVGFDTSWSVVTEVVEEFFLARGPSSSAEVRGLVVHDIKEVEGVRQQEEQEDKRDGRERR